MVDLGLLCMQDQQFIWATNLGFKWEAYIIVNLFIYILL